MATVNSYPFHLFPERTQDVRRHELGPVRATAWLLWETLWETRVINGE